MKIKKKKLKKIFEDYFKLVIKTEVGCNDFVCNLEGSGFTLWNNEIMEVCEAEKIIYEQTIRNNSPISTGIISSINGDKYFDLDNPENSKV